MKIAVYGDSYVDNGFDYGNKLSSIRHTWISMLAQDLGATAAVTWHGKGGSSTYWSYQQILARKEPVDRIIWAVSSPDRYPVQVPWADYRMKFVPNVNLIPLVHSDFQQDLESWYKMSDPTFMKTAQELMVDHVATLWPTIIIIPCFENSLTPEQQSRFGWGEFHLTKFNRLFMQHYFGCNKLLQPLQEERRNMVQHIPIEWHETVADLVYQSITQGRLPQMPRIDQLPALTHHLSTYVT